MNTVRKSQCRAAHTASKQFGIDPKVALLSYSSMGSAKGECVPEND